MSESSNQIRAFFEQSIANNQASAAEVQANERARTDNEPSNEKQAEGENAVTASLLNSLYEANAAAVASSSSQPAIK